VVRPFERMYVVGIEAEFEKIFLGETEMFDELPRRVLKARSVRTAKIGRNSFDRLLESDVGLLPVEDACELRSDKVGCLVHDNLVLLGEPPASARIDASDPSTVIEDRPLLQSRPRDDPARVMRLHPNVRIVSACLR